MIAEKLRVGSYINKLANQGKHEEAHTFVMWGQTWYCPERGIEVTRYQRVAEKLVDSSPFDKWLAEGAPA